VDGETEFVAVACKVARTLNGGALLDVLEDLRVARLKANDKQAAAGLAHGLERFVVGGDARSAGPGEVERLQLFTELDGANLLDVEGVVVEEELFDFGEVLLGPLKLGSNIIRRALAPGVTGKGLRPQAEGALGRAATRGVERNVGVQQKRHVVAGDVHVALVNLGGPGHRVQVFSLRAVGIVHDLAVELVTDAEDFAEGLALSKLDNGEVELTAADEVENGTLVEGAVGVRGDRWPDKSDSDGGIGSFDGLGEALIAFPADSGGKEDEEFEVFADFNGLRRGDVMGRGIEDARPLEHAGGICEPDGVPVGLNLAGCGPA